MDILKYEKSFKEKGYNNIVGIDEAGRGPLAGPVVAVSVNWGNNPIIEGVKDSKKITEKKRLKLFDIIMETALDIGIGIVHEDKIDDINILQATYLAMKISIGNLKIKPDILLIDGKKADIHHIEQKNIIKGDSLSYTIACASIVAKVTRDKMMLEYGKVFPEYNFQKHKGYGTKFHLDIIKSKKSCPIHRKSFKPINMFLPTMDNFSDDNQKYLLGLQIIASDLIKKNFSIIFFNDKYDLIYLETDCFVIVDTKVVFKSKTILSKISQNKVNLSSDLKTFLSNQGYSNFSRFRIDQITIEFLSGTSHIRKSKGSMNDF